MGEQGWVVAVVAIVGVALIKGGVDMLLWFSFRRQVELQDRRVGTLSEDVRDLRDQKVASIETAIVTHAEADDRRHEAAVKSRRELHAGMAKLDKDKVGWADCNRMHEGYTSQLQEQARIGTRLEIVSKRTEEMFDRLIAAKSDIDKSVERIDALQRRVGGHHDA